MTPCNYCGAQFADPRDVYAHHGEDCPGRDGLTPPERAELARLVWTARDNGSTGGRVSTLVEALGLSLTGRATERRRRGALVLDRYEDTLADWLEDDQLDGGYLSEELEFLGLLEPAVRECGLCIGTGIGQHGDPDTSRCSACNGRGVAA